MTQMIVDIHTHNHQSIVPAIQSLTFIEANKLLHSEEKGLFSIGIHPWHIDISSKDKLLQIAKWANDKRIIAIGECGLDKHSEVSIDIQIDIFKTHILLSEQIKKPMIIHCVSCFNELFEIKKRMNPKQLWIIHGFRGKPELAKQALRAGCSLSFGENYNSESVKLTRIENLYIETDESLLSIETIYANIAITKGCSVANLTAGAYLLHQYNVM